MSIKALEDRIKEAGIDLPETDKVYEVHIKTADPTEIRQWVEANIEVHMVEAIHAYSINGTNPVEYQMTVFLTDQKAATLVTVMWANAKAE